MPLTPFHLGAGIFIAALFLKTFNIWALLAGSVVMDFEPLILVIVKHCYHCPHHGFFHSILGAIIGSIIIAVFLWLFKNFFKKISPKTQSFSFIVLFYSALIAWLIHIFIDSMCHSDVFLFFPSLIQPTFIGRFLYWPLGGALFLLGIVGLIILVVKLLKLKK